ncbi:MAG: 50S ribosomal protein L24 [Candidatus Midichloria mitochondrii]|uniref:Large ribosomal subunit protein uL24 n=1 Tax=Midichloria mitochondrii (strain IricVA) TaxID=696127 RepID=F7XUL1_MIDMI|nr:50S ribosomal protein L24 [Candidatus Midichloria mitochondrii]AEI88360.1 ribosomal protein L24 [Candidatus Midichloria mitochondrii IricVA]MDJ1256350.1 50S ribosomal protein L24 [Candidatus Midichloria mitochondrii]MDJ1288056.1 50S ribosomal protein L24 [Candidatus Midichloria mitochondrii]MDJ1298894.1 50S ribosomal protein L24 [Candidatus Midichloria mitochondrii]MDJ1313110.1 50S ribosomal protein L24 [Candidatus Midichloria mitochondrii]
MTSKKFRRDDEVFVIAGKDKGKKGKITKVIPDKGRVIVSGINIAKRHVKPSKKVPSGGVIPKEMPMDISNLSHIDPKSGIPTRVGFKFLEDGRKVRYAKKSGELIDKI